MHWGWLRIAVLVLAGVELALLVAGELLALGSLASVEQLSRSIGTAVATFLIVPLLLAAAAFALGMLNRWLWLALAITVLLPAGVLVVRQWL